MGSRPVGRIYFFRNFFFSFYFIYSFFCHFLIYLFFIFFVIIITVRIQHCPTFLPLMMPRPAALCIILCNCLLMILQLTLTIQQTNQRCDSQNLYIVVYAHGRRLCSNRVRHGSTTISYPQCSLASMRERCLHRSFAYTKSAVGIDVVSVHKLFAYRVVSTVSTDVVSSHTKYCRISYDITRWQNALQGTNG